MALGTPKVIPINGAEEVIEELTAYDAPDALDAVYQDAVKFLRRRKTTGNVGNHLAQFDLRRNVAESRLSGGCTFPDTITAALGVEGAP